MGAHPPAGVYVLGVGHCRPSLQQAQITSELWGVQEPGRSQALMVGDVVSSPPKAQKQLTGQRVVGKAGGPSQRNPPQSPCRVPGHGCDQL